MNIKYLSHYEVTAEMQDGISVSGFSTNERPPRLDWDDIFTVFEDPACESSYVEVRSKDVVRLHVNPIISDKPL